MSNTYTINNVNIGVSANDGSGDPIRTAFLKINQNFANVYSYANLAYYNGVGGNGGGGTIINNYGGNLNFEGWPNITSTNLAILIDKMSAVTYTDLSKLANALALVTPVDLGKLQNALANVSPVYLGDLQNALANVATVDLSNLQNILATVNVTSLTNFTNVFNSITANASAAGVVSLVTNLSANGTANGQSVYNTTDGGLYIWDGTAWISPRAAFTPTANSLASIEIWNTTPLPTTDLFEGRTVLYTFDNNMYIYVGGAWNNYNAYIAGSGNVTLGAGAISSSAMLAANVVVAGKIAAGAITVGTIAAGAIRSTEIAAGNITSSLLAANAVIAGKIAAGVITAQEIAAGAVTATQIAANSIYTLAIQAGAVTANTIAANAVTAVQIAANSVYANAIQSNSIDTRMLRANIITAVEIAANSVYANAIQSNSIETRMLRANIITAVEIAANSVYANAIQSNSIDTRMLRANIITAVEIAANSVYAAAIQANSITANQIAANAITAVELAANSIFAFHIMANAITANKIEANSISTVKLQANAVTADKIDGRNLVIRDAAGNPLFAAGLLASTVSVALPSGGTTTLGAAVANVSAATAKWIDLNNDHPGFGVLNNAPTNTPEIVFTANLTGMSGTATFTVTAGTATLTSTTDPNVKKLTFANMVSNSVTIKASYVDGATTYSDIVSVYKVYNGNTTPLMYLTDENKTVPASNTGVVSSFTGVSTQAVVYLGLVDDSANWTYATTAVGCTIAGTNTRNISVTAMSADTATVTFVASKSGYSNLTKVYNLSKAKAGTNGAAGAPGTPGGAGTRGSIRTSGTAPSAAWSDAAAVTAISAAGGGTPIRTDEVTLIFPATNPTFTATKVYDGSAWNTIAAVINGGLIVNGTIIADKLATGTITADKIGAGQITTAKLEANAITADKIAAGAITASDFSSGPAVTIAGGKFGIGATQALSGFPGVGFFETSLVGKFALLVSSTVIQDALAVGCNAVGAGGNAATFWRFKDGTYVGGGANLHTYTLLSNDTVGVTSFAQNSTGAFGEYLGQMAVKGLRGGSFYSYTNSTTVAAAADFTIKGTGSTAKAAQFQHTVTEGATVSTNIVLADAAGAALRVYAGDIKTGPATITTFTGSHDALMDPTEVIEPGDIVVDVSVVATKLVSDALTIVTKSTQPNQKSILGVFRNAKDDAYLPHCLIDQYFTENTTHIQSPELDPENPDTLQTIQQVSRVWGERIIPEYEDVWNNHTCVFINSVGEGLINVCGENGDIEIGDYITTSSIAGKGMKQTDDILHNYTVAKAREAVTFSSPTEVKQIACSYHCG